MNDVVITSAEEDVTKAYPDEIFEVTKDLINNWERCAVIVNHTIPFDDVVEALKTASTPGAADKVIVTFN